MMRFDDEDDGLDMANNKAQRIALKIGGAAKYSILQNYETNNLRQNSKKWKLKATHFAFGAAMLTSFIL